MAASRIARRTALVSLIISALALLVVACGGGGDDDKTPASVSPGATSSTTSSTPGATPTPMTFERSDGKTVTITGPAKRIVSLSPGATEIIYAIGGEGSLIAVDKQADYPQGAADFETKVDAFAPNVEAIAALQPDLVVVATDPGGLVDALDRLKIPVLFIDINTDVLTIDDVIEQVPVFGRITGREDAASELASQMTARAKAVDDKLKALAEHPSVYHELDSTFYSVSDQSFIGNLYARLNAANVAGDGGGSPYPQLTQEAIIAANPEIIVLADEEFGVSVDSVKARPGWDVIDAVKNDRIYAIDPDIISRPGPRIVDALEELAKDFYPELYQ